MLLYLDADLFAACLVVLDDSKFRAAAKPEEGDRPRGDRGRSGAPRAQDRRLPFRAALAEVEATRYRKRFPARDDGGNYINQETEHRRGRDAKIWRKPPRRDQNEALVYVSAAVVCFGVQTWAFSIRRVEVKRF